MDEPADTSYQPPAGFAEDKKDPLIDLDLTDSTELWLIQWPINQPPDFDGQHVSLKLAGDGRMGALEESSGKSYEIVSNNSQGPEATVFLTSKSGAKIVGKISRRVALVHYPEPGELLRRNNPSLSHSQRSSSTPSRSIRPTKSSISGYSTPGSKRGPVSGFGDSSRPPKRKRPEQSKSTSHSGKGNSDHSQERKPKNKKSRKIAE